MVKQSIFDSAQRYQVRWRKMNDAPGRWCKLKITDSLKEARAWRDQWGESSSCADIFIFDTQKKIVVS